MILVIKQVQESMKKVLVLLKNITLIISVTISQKI